jgi:hypothetical protein
VCASGLALIMLGRLAVPTVPSAGASGTSSSAPCRTVVRVRTVTKTRTVEHVVYRTRTVVQVVYRYLVAPTATPQPTQTPVVQVVYLPAPTATPVPTATAPQNAASANGVVVTASNLHAESITPEAAGHQYIVVRITLTNQGTQAAHFNALDFQLADGGDHIRHDATLVDSNIASTVLTYGSLLGGQSVAGDVAFAVPTAETSFTLLWTPSWGSDSLVVPLT